jgi:hypothetical protein
MRYNYYITFIGIVLLISCHPTETKTSEFASASQVEKGKPVSVMLTSYSTTLLANGKDRTNLRIAVTDSIGREIISASDTIHIYVNGDGKVTASDGSSLILRADTTGEKYVECRLIHGTCHLLFMAGTKPDKIKIKARSGKLWPGSHEIHTLPADFVMMKPLKNQLTPTSKQIDKMIGADISFLPQIEDQGRKFFEKNKEKDAIELLRDHGFNYIRLRIFVNPENARGYSPGRGYCGLQQTLTMAKRIKNAGMKLLLDFHYSDYWADPQQQYKPQAWSDLNFPMLKDSVKTYTTNVILALKKQGTLPAMVQVGNEINHGFLWPEGHISHPDQLADLLKAGIEGIRTVSPDLPVMMHLALGGQHTEAVFWLDNMIARGVKFDIIGLSYYPRWHGTLDDLKNNLLDLINRYHKPMIVVEYSDYKREVNNIEFNLPDNMGKGSYIWEPLGWRSGLFDQKGGVQELIFLYDELKEKYLTKSN